MEVVLAVASLLVAALTLYSGFGLGTLLLPVLALFYAPHVAVAATAVVHLANNLLKVALVGRRANAGVLLRFALPAIPAAFLGAWLLSRAARLPALTTYGLGGRTFEITPIGIIVGVLVMLFAVWELRGARQDASIPARWLPLGGALSGFFGGLSGHQGALRSAFLLRAGLSKEGYIGTAVVAATLVDLTRLLVYGGAWFGSRSLWSGEQSLRPLGIALVFAFLGTFLGTRLIGKVTLAGLHRLVGVLLLLAGIVIALDLR